MANRGTRLNGRTFLMPTNSKTDGATRTRLLVIGMRDNAGREAVVEALSSIVGVVECEVSIFHARATIVHMPPCEVSALVGAVERVGFRASPVSRA